MNKGFKLYKWEVVLGMVLALVLVSGGLSLQTQAALADDVVRLHVLAHSDTEDDQALKLLVRDAVLDQATTLLQGVTTQDQAVTLLNGHLQDLESMAQQVVFDQGYRYDVAVTLSQEDYPAKDYDGFALPAGEYVSLRVIIGDGAGQNWWCVAFPPLCTAATSELVVTAMANGLDDQQVSLITQEEGYELRFKLVDWWSELAQKLD